MLNIEEIQKYLKSEKLDGWLLADFHSRNNVMIELLDLPASLTRRTYYFIPTNGEPIALVHNIEQEKFKHISGKKIRFSSYRILEETLRDCLKGAKRIAMEYSSHGRLPYIGLVEAGTIELIRSFGLEIISSADMVANFQARMSEEQVALHRKAAVLVNQVKDETFAYIRENLVTGKEISEMDAIDFMIRRFRQLDMVFDFPPHCAVEANISIPHYEPPQRGSAIIKKGHLIIIDLWAKLNARHSVYADITWMAYAGYTVPEKYRDVFSIVLAARDRAVSYIKEKFPAVYGYDVDDACREVINKAGYGEYFFHRTGHSILEAVHGPGPNIDNLETEDRRRLMPGHLFSVEPGIYLPEYGFRSEINVMITESGPEITTLPIQQEIIALLG